MAAASIAQGEAPRPGEDGHNDVPRQGGGGTSPLPCPHLPEPYTPPALASIPHRPHPQHPALRPAAAALSHE